MRPIKHLAQFMTGSKRCQVENRLLMRHTCPSVPEGPRHLLVPQFLYLQMGIIPLGGFRDFILIKHLTQCLACSQLSIGYSPKEVFNK